jgi:hypothetical protein
MAIGLFGTSFGATSDQDILDKIRQEQMARNRAMTSNLGKYAGLAQAGMEAAQGFNTSVGRLFGAEDPRLQKNSLLREAGDAVKARGVDMSDALATLKAFSEELMKRGLYQEATALVPQIQQAQRQAAQDARAAAQDVRAERQLQISEDTLALKQSAEDRARISAGLEANRKTTEFYKKNPEQAEFRLQELARIIQADPNNQAALKEYESITAAGSQGAIERTGRQAKEELEARKEKALIEKYNKETKEVADNSKLTPAQRWNAERQAAIELFKAYNLDPAAPLTGANSMNPALTGAQKQALRSPVPEGAQVPAMPAPAAPKPGVLRFDEKGNPIK